MSGQEETPSPVLGAGAGAAVQSDAVSHYHWMTGAQFLNAVALGQITPGPVVQTVAVVGCRHHLAVRRRRRGHYHALTQRARSGGR
jgi:hypothetical protein